MPSRFLSAHFATVLFLAVGFIPAGAQQTPGDIVGRVLDASGAPVGQALVSASGPSAQGARGTVTNEQGRFVLSVLPVGMYTVHIVHAAYQNREISDVRVRLGESTSLGDLRLVERVHAVEEVVVSGHAPVYDPGSTTAGGVLDASDYNELPVDRDYKSVAALLPHANLSPLGDPVNMAGATGLENRYFIDGADVTDPFRNATGTQLPYNFVRELQVSTGGYEAEYRSALGGTTNVVTYSGGNAVSGQAFGYFTGNGFSSTPRSIPGSPDQGDFSSYDFGVGMGGPLRKDRLWYFVAYDPTFHQEDLVSPGWGSYSDHQTTHSVAGKLTWQANSMNSFVLTAIGDPRRGVEVAPPLVAPGNPDPFLFDIKQGGWNLILEGRHGIGSHMFLQSSLSGTTRDDQHVPSTGVGKSEPLFVDSTGVASGGAESSDNKSRTLQMGVRATWILGNHELKSGVSYKTTHLEFDTESVIIREGSATSYTTQGRDFQGEVGTRAPSAFLQDAWHVTPRLEVHAGLRWDGQYFVSSRGDVAQSITDQWQPRVGAAYQLGAKQRVFGSFGRYFQDLTTAPLFWYYNEGTTFFSYNYDHDPRADPSGGTTVYDYSGGILPRQDLQGQYFDEFSVGYERALGTRAKAGARGLFRTLRQGIEDGYDVGTGMIVFGNPGRGSFAAFPEMK